MQCAQCEAVLPAYVDGQLPSAQMRRVGEHVHSCASCRQALNRHQETRGLLERLDDEGWTPPDLRLRVALALRQQGEAQTSARRARLLIPAFAAVLALSMVMGAAMGPLSSSPQTPALAPASHASQHNHGRTPAMAIQL